MPLKKTAVLILCFLLAARSFSVAAFETDQYNLPEKPLADIGDEVSAYVDESIAEAIGKINSRIDQAQDCFDRKCEAPEKNALKLEKLRSEETAAREVFKILGGGVPPFTNSGTWMEKHEFKAQPARYKTSFEKSIYHTAPLNYLTISETVKIYGVEFGTDKIAHVFQQGYTYYRIARRARGRNLAYAEGAAKAVAWGRRSEKTFYGFWVSGVYSNADLAANFAGMKFYENLTREIMIGDLTLAPILTLKNGRWQFNENAAPARKSLLKPFVSNHFNEALNPSVYISLFGFRAAVRRTVEKQACPAWRTTFPDLSAADFAAVTESLKLWHGEDYGFKNSRDSITIAGTCFATDGTPSLRAAQRSKNAQKASISFNV